MSMKCKPCRYSDFATESYRSIERDLKIRQIYPWHSAASQDFANRKFWEWCQIAAVLDEFGKLQYGSKGLGFAVGTEPLASYFAARGCDILATDLSTALSSQGWIDRNEHAESLENIFYKELVSRDEFDRRVVFKPADMRTLQGIDGQYDFLWSSCALEHLGSLDAGFQFIEKSLELLKPGGIAVHTTEYNVSSNADTVAVGDNVIYRRSDIEDLYEKLSGTAYRMAEPDFDCGNSQQDFEPDLPPYFQGDKYHIKLLMDGFVATSYLLIIERPPEQ